MSYDVWISTEEQERYEKILSAFTEVAGVASGCAESCNMVLDWIKNTLKTLPEKVSSETNQPTAIGQGGRNINVENTTNIFDLVVTRKKVVHLTKGKRTNFKRGKQKKKKVVPSSISVKESQGNVPLKNDLGKKSKVIPSSISVEASSCIRVI